MANPDFVQAVACLQENLALLTDIHGKTPPEHQPMFNVSNALLVVCDALEDIQIRLTKLERRLPG